MNFIIIKIINQIFYKELKVGYKINGKTKGK